MGNVHDIKVPEIRGSADATFVIAFVSQPTLEIDADAIGVNGEMVLFLRKNTQNGIVAAFPMREITSIRERRRLDAGDIRLHEN